MKSRIVCRWRLTLLMPGILPVLMVLVDCSTNTPSGPLVLAAPHVFSGPVNGGCYLDTVTTCRLHIDNWQPIVIDPNTSLEGFQLKAYRSGAPAGLILYDFRTDLSNPPGNSYLPSRVKKDFAADCGTSYQLSLTAKDSGDLSFEEIGRTNDFSCPAAATATPTTMPTATITPEATIPPSAGWKLLLPITLK
ncbi:MAG: hypothetical protein R6X18_17570 [Chloroflexota bacterium]